MAITEMCGTQVSAGSWLTFKEHCNVEFVHPIYQRDAHGLEDKALNAGVTGYANRPTLERGWLSLPTLSSANAELSDEATAQSRE